MPSACTMAGPYLASLCACGQAFTIGHVLSCSTGGYPSIHHNELRDITANVLKEVGTDVTMEPSLQLLTGESAGHENKRRLR